MRIVSSRVIPVGGPTGPVGTARTPVTRREGAWLVLVAEGGLEGVGEATPLPGRSPDDVACAARALAGVHLALAALRTDREAAAAIARAVSPARRELASSPAARFAVETALLDLLGRWYRLPAHRLLGGRAAAPIPRAVLLPGPCDARTAAQAGAAIARGIITLKLKLGARPFAEELAALRRLRAGLGPDVALRLDANGSLGADAARRLEALAELRPAFVEEPVSGEALLALLDAGPAAPVAADESLAVPGLAARLLAHPALGAVVVKPALLGLLRAKAIAVDAARRRLPVVVTHLFDGPVALAACAELALSLREPAACGLDPHSALAAFPPLAVPQLADPAYVTPACADGLGIDRPSAEERAPGGAP